MMELLLKALLGTLPFCALSFRLRRSARSVPPLKAPPSSLRPGSICPRASCCFFCLVPFTLPIPAAMASSKAFCSRATLFLKLSAAAGVSLQCSDVGKTREGRLHQSATQAGPAQTCSSCAMQAGSRSTSHVCQIELLPGAAGLTEADLGTHALLRFGLHPQLG